MLGLVERQGTFITRSTGFGFIERTREEVQKHVLSLSKG